MEKQELLEKAKKREITKQEVFEHFGVKNIEGLESVLSEKLDIAKDSFSFLEGSLNFIYATKTKEDYNPIEEMYTFYAVAAQGIYGFAIDDISILNGAFGSFKTVMILENILSSKPEVMFFQSMYKKYVERMENISYTISKGASDLLNYLSKNLEKMDPKDIDKILGEFKSKAQELIQQTKKD
jgi:hypothetical protein